MWDAPRNHFSATFLRRLLTPPWEADLLVSTISWGTTFPRKMASQKNPVGARRRTPTGARKTVSPCPGGSSLGGSTRLLFGTVLATPVAPPPGQQICWFACSPWVPRFARKGFHKWTNFRAPGGGPRKPKGRENRAPKRDFPTRRKLDQGFQNISTE